MSSSGFASSTCRSASFPASSDPTSLPRPIASAPIDRRDAQHVVRLHAAARDVPHLPVHAESLQLAVAAESDAAARFDDLLRLLGEQLERVLAVAEPAAAAAAPRRSSSVNGVKCVSFGSLEDVVVLVPVVLGPRAAVLHDQRRRLRRAALREQLHDVLVQRRDRQRVLDARVAVHRLGHVLLEVEPTLERRRDAAAPSPP